MLRVRETERQTDRNRQRQEKRGKDRETDRERERNCQGPGDEAVVATTATTALVDLNFLNSQLFYHACPMGFKVTPFFLVFFL